MDPTLFDMLVNIWTAMAVRCQAMSVDTLEPGARTTQCAKGKLGACFGLALSGTFTYFLKIIIYILFICVLIYLLFFF